MIKGKCMMSRHKSSSTVDPFHYQEAHTDVHMDTPIAQWLAWNIHAHDAMNAIIRYATAKSATNPSTINIEEIRILNCHTYTIFIKSGGPYHDSIYVPAFEEVMVLFCQLLKLSFRVGTAADSCM